MEPLADRIARGDPLLLDGAMGTELLRQGLTPGECPELLNVTRPDVLEGIARAYVEAGADLILTNTFGGSTAKLAPYGLEQRMHELNEAGVCLARRAAGGRAYVAASCGPSGRLLKPYGDTDPDELLDGFRAQMECLLAAGVDALCIETTIDLNEALLLIRAARDASSDIPVTATMTFDPTPRGFVTVMGVTIEQAARRLPDAGADAVGSNCGNGIDHMVAIAREFRRHTDGPLIIQSNAGLPEIRDGLAVYAETPDFMAARIPELLDIGVTLIGGCCGTTPHHIHAFRNALRKRGHSAFPPAP